MVWLDLVSYDVFVLFGTIGLAWGTGTAFGHRVVDSVMGPRTFKHETVVSQVPSAANTMTACDIHSKAFQDVS